MEVASLYISGVEKQTFIISVKFSTKSNVPVQNDLKFTDY